MRRILTFALTALLLCAASAQTNNIKRPTKKRPATTKIEKYKSSTEKKTKHAVKKADSKKQKSPSNPDNETLTNSEPLSFSTPQNESQTNSEPLPFSSPHNESQTNSTPSLFSKPKIKPLNPNLVYTPDVLTFDVNGVSFQMVEVRGGTFRMGSAYDAESFPDHNVTLGDYYIGKTEVTQALWAAVMGETLFQVCVKISKHNCVTAGVGPDYPMYYISWKDCQTFIEKLNKLTGKKFRMPTEAEWEFACRGGNNSYGYMYSGSNNIDYVAWSGNNSGGKTHPVGVKISNELGIYDMTGNVSEWCADKYGKYKPDYCDSYTSNSQLNPTGPKSGSRRVFRGGSWSCAAGRSRSLCRNYNSPSDRDCDLGLRLAL